MGLSSKEVSSVGIGSDRFLPAPSSSMKRQSSSSSSPSPTPSSSASQQQKVQQSEPLKCPRCDSTNTKFCYYNNYNKSQPRHFCKTCKRHWTKGGTLRNVPVGGGRKNKRKMSNTGIKATSKTTTTTIGAATAALITGMSNTTMTTIQPQQPRLNIPLGTLGGVDEKNLSEAFYQTLGRHPPCSMPDSSIAFSHKSINEGNNGIFLGSTRSLPHNEQQDLNFPFSNLGGNFESNPCSVSSIQCSNLYNYTGDQASNSLEETIMNSLNTNLISSSMRMGDHQHQQSWSMATNTSTVMSMTSNWGWDDLEKYVSVDESELTIPWDDADIKP